MTLTRCFFAALSIFFMVAYTLSHPEHSWGIQILAGAGLGTLFFFFLVTIDFILRKHTFRSFNVVALGLFAGYFMGSVLINVFDATFANMPTVFFASTEQFLIKIACLLLSLYLGVIFSLRSADALYLSVPFIRLSEMDKRKKDIVLDISAVCDSRLVDLCACGILNDQVILPNFILKDLYLQLEANDEMYQMRAKKGIDVIKKLQSMPNLHMRSEKTNFPHLADVYQKTLHLTRLIDAKLLTADISHLQHLSQENLEIINLHALSNAMKPLMQSGESIKIKVQRYGKEPRQGVGYLDDGTMVVINNGGDFLGEVIDTQVISVKHTSAGRIVFTNATCDPIGHGEEEEQLLSKSGASIPPHEI